jgi:hypothetical protein
MTTLVATPQPLAIDTTPDGFKAFAAALVSQLSVAATSPKKGPSKQFVRTRPPNPTLNQALVLDLALLPVKVPGATLAQTRRITLVAALAPSLVSPVVRVARPRRSLLHSKPPSTMLLLNFPLLQISCTWNLSAVKRVGGVGLGLHDRLLFQNQVFFWLVVYVLSCMMRSQCLVVGCMFLCFFWS